MPHTPIREDKDAATIQNKVRLPQHIPWLLPEALSKRSKGDPKATLYVGPFYHSSIILRLRTARNTKKKKEKHTKMAKWITSFGWATLSRAKPKT